MNGDRSFVERNRAETARIRDLAERLSDEEFLHPVGEHWTVGMALAHLAFWDARVLAVLDAYERQGKIVVHDIDIVVNDILLPTWAAIPPREAARLALETAEELDKRLELLAPDVRAQLAEASQRFVMRAMHRGEHLDEVEEALRA